MEQYGSQEAAANGPADDEDDFDLFGSDDEDVTLVNTSKLTYGFIVDHVMCVCVCVSG